MSNHAPFDWANAIPLTSPALGALLQARLEQISRYGHTPESDDATGPAPLISAARKSLLKALQHDFAEAEQELQAAGDMAMGNIAHLGDASLKTLYTRAIRAGAICLALGELIDRERSRR